MTLLVMYDDVTVDAIPAGAKYIAAYADGPFANVGAARARFPHDPILTITVNGGDADACDCEPGDLTNDDAIAWVERRLAAGAYRPCVYSDQSNWDSGLGAALAHYGARIRRWQAHFDGVPVLPAGFDAKQYATGSVDTNVTADDFFDGPHPPKPEPKAKGVAHMLVSCELEPGHWTIHHLPGTADFKGHAFAAEIRVDEHELKIQGVPADTKPLG